MLLPILLSDEDEMALDLREVFDDIFDEERLFITDDDIILDDPRAEESDPREDREVSDVDAS